MIYELFNNTYNYVDLIMSDILLLQRQAAYHITNLYKFIQHIYFPAINLVWG